MLSIKVREKTPSRANRIFWLILMSIILFPMVAVLIVLLGANPFIAYRELFFAPFRDVHTITETLVTMTPLLFIALGLSISYKSRFWNIGGDGQFYAGALTCTATVLALKGIGVPSVLFIILLMVVGFLGGAFWSTIAAVLKTKFNIDEIISTLMLNFVMIYFIAIFLYGPWMDPASAMPQTVLFPTSARIPTLVPGTRLHIGFFFFIFLVPIVYLILNKTVLGYQIKTIGSSIKGARYGGMNPGKTFLLVAILSGGLAGLAGMVEVSGVYYRLRDDISPGYGYTAILVALLGRNHPGWVTLVAFLFGVLSVGGYEMQIATGIPYALSLVTQGLIYFTVLFAEALARYKIKLGGK